MPISISRRVLVAGVAAASFLSPKPASALITSGLNFVMNKRDFLNELSKLAAQVRQTMGAINDVKKLHGVDRVLGIFGAVQQTSELINSISALHQEHSQKVEVAVGGLSHPFPNSQVGGIHVRAFGPFVPGSQNYQGNSWTRALFEEEEASITVPPQMINIVGYNPTRFFPPGAEGVVVMSTAFGTAGTIFRT